MMKRIISLILVAVMSVAVLTGCAYNYNDDKMTNYATFDADSFRAALLDSSIEVSDGDFGIDEGIRLQKVVDAIFTELAGKADTADKKTEGVLSKYDMLYYAYYVTDAEGHMFYADKMKEGATKLQLGLSSTKGYQSKIAEAIAGKDIKDCIYSTATEGETALGNIVFVSYTLEYVDYIYDEQGNKVKGDDGNFKTTPKKVTVTNQMLTLAESTEGVEPHESSFIAKLISKEGSVVKVGEALNFNINWTAGDGAVDLEANEEYKYTGVKVNWVVKSMTDLVSGGIKDVTYTTDTKVKDVFGTEYNLKDKELTYHVFPAHYISVASELTADVVLDNFYSALLSTEKSEGEDVKYMIDFIDARVYKNGDVALVDLLTEFKSLQESLESAKKDTKSAEEKVEKLEGGTTDADKTNLALAQTELEEKQAAQQTAQTKVDEQKAKILAATAEGRDIKTDLVEGYKEYKYETLENSYKDALKQSLAAEIYSLAQKYLTYKTDDNGITILPRKAVNEAYKRLENNYKYDFYEGNYTNSSSSSTTATVTNYKHYEGNFDAFLKAELGLKSDATQEQIEAQIGLKAENSVKELILVYTLAEMLGEAVEVTDEDIDEFKTSWQYWYLSYIMGEDSVDESDFIHAIQLDNIFNYILEENKENTENRVDYVRVKYVIKDN